MTLLAAEHLTKRFKDQSLLEDVSFTIEGHDRIALVGRNGSGKTTLLEILAGKQETDSGGMNRPRSTRIDYVEQEKTEYLHQSLFEFVAAARQDLLDMRATIAELEQYLTSHPDNKEKVDQLGELHHTYEVEEGHNLEYAVTRILLGLGFDEDRHHDPLRQMSGGEKNRAGLARILAGRGNLLLLDEPTNHLDIESTRWLEDYLKNMNSAYVIVSHDRSFLTAAADQVWEIGYGKIEVYHNGFNSYLSERLDRRRIAEHRYRHQQEHIAKIEDYIRRNMAGQKTKQAQSRLKYLNKIKRLPPPRTGNRGPAIKVESSGRSFNHVLSLEDVALGYGRETVIDKVTCDLYRGDKVGLIGRNGSGKSTLLKGLLGEIEPITGAIRLGTNVDVAYFDQELSDLNLELSVLDTIWEMEPAAEVGKIRSYLGRFGFTGEESLKVVAALSGGEKTKLCLAKLLYHPANFIILDEPTNHLDIDAREALEQALIDYEGTCLIVSHDRYFLDRVVNKVLHISHGRIHAYNGNYSYFVEKTQAVPTPSLPKTKDDKPKQDFVEFKEQSKKKARVKRELQSARSKVADLEKELGQLEEQIATTIPRHDWEALQTAAMRKKEVEQLILELYVRIDELEQIPND